MNREEIIKKAFLFHSKGEISEANKYYENFINHGFLDHRVFNNYGIIQKDIGNLKKAEILQRKAIEIKPDFSSAHFNLGLILRDLGNLKEAELSFRNALKINPNLAGANCELGLTLYSVGNLKEAEIFLRKAIKINPNYVEAHSNLGVLQNHLGNFKEAEKSLKEAINVNPNIVEIYLNLGKVLQNLDNFEEAEIFLRKAIEINPNYVEANCNLGLILYSLGNLKEAEIFLRKAININPKDPDTYLNLGVVLQELDKVEEAKSSFREAIKINPKYAAAYSNLGSLLRHLGDLKEAEKCLRKAIEIMPANAEICSNLGILLRDVGNLEEAELFLRNSIKINPNYAEAFSNLGVIFGDLDNLKEAEKYLRKAIKVKPNLASALCNLGNILFNLGNVKEAEPYLVKAIKIKPNYADAHFLLGAVLRSQGNLQEAELSLQKAIEIKSDFAQAYFLLSTLTCTKLDNELLKNKLFSNDVLESIPLKDKCNVFFARSNILHNGKNYNESAKNLELANNLKLKLFPSNASDLIKQSKELLIKTNIKKTIQDSSQNFPESIFIVGMPRSGSTLVESILSMNKNVYDLGEINICEKTFLEWNEYNCNLSFAKIYFEKINQTLSDFKITTNKWLYNYQYAGIISSQLPNSKIIHCFRNPLDNILSIYKANFTKGNTYSSSLIDCAKVYLNQDEVMKYYKDQFRSKIYDLNYDLMVENPRKEIKSLISWLGWEWNDEYLSPHLNTRTVLTASTVQVRSPINSKSIGGWKNYKEMLCPAMNIIKSSQYHGNYKH